MQRVMYSSKHRELIDAIELKPADEVVLWNELYKERQLANDCWSK